MWGMLLQKIRLQAKIKICQATDYLGRARDKFIFALLYVLVSYNSIY